MRNWCIETGLDFDGPIIIFCDNDGARSLTETTKQHGVSKHIDTRQHYIRELVEEHRITVQRVESAANLADILTKPLPKSSHNRIVSEIGLDWRTRGARGSVED